MAVQVVFACSLAPSPLVSWAYPWWLAVSQRGLGYSEVYCIPAHLYPGRKEEGRKQGETSKV